MIRSTLLFINCVAALLFSPQVVRTIPAEATASPASPEAKGTANTQPTIAATPSKMIENSVVKIFATLRPIGAER